MSDLNTILKKEAEPAALPGGDAAPELPPDSFETREEEFLRLEALEQMLRKYYGAMGMSADDINKHVEMDIGIPEYWTRKTRVKAKPARRATMAKKSAMSLVVEFIKESRKLKPGSMKGPPHEPASKAKAGEGGRFKALEKKIGRKGGVRDPKAVAASIGRAKFGKKKFQQMAAKGRKAASEEKLSVFRSVVEKWASERGYKVRLSKKAANPILAGPAGPLFSRVGRDVANLLGGATGRPMDARQNLAGGMAPPWLPYSLGRTIFSNMPSILRRLLPRLPMILPPTPSRLGAGLMGPPRPPGPAGGR